MTLERRLTMDDFLPLREPSRANAADWSATRIASGHMDTSSSWIGCGGVQHTRANVEHHCATFEMPETARALRDLLTDDLPAIASSTKLRRRDGQRSGSRVNARQFARWDDGGGSEAFWTRYERRERKSTGVVTIASNFGLSGSQTASQLEVRGAAALALTDWLEALGYTVELDGVITSLGHPFADGKYSVTVPVKEAGQPASEQGMAIICDAGIRRALWWTHLLSQDRRCADGLGNPVEYDGERTYDVTVPRGMRTIEQAAQWVRDTVGWLRERDNDPDAPQPTISWM